MGNIKPISNLYYTLYCVMGTPKSNVIYAIIIIISKKIKN